MKNWVWSFQVISCCSNGGLTAAIGAVAIGDYGDYGDYGTNTIANLSYLVYCNTYQWPGYSQSALKEIRLIASEFEIPSSLQLLGSEVIGAFLGMSHYDGRRQFSICHMKSFLQCP